MCYLGLFRLQLQKPNLNQAAYVQTGGFYGFHDWGPLWTSQVGKQLGFRKGFCKWIPENPQVPALLASPGPLSLSYRAVFPVWSKFCRDWLSLAWVPLGQSTADREWGHVVGPRSSPSPLRVEKSHTLILSRLESFQRMTAMAPIYLRWWLRWKDVEGLRQQVTEWIKVKPRSRVLVFSLLERIRSD